MAEGALSPAEFEALVERFRHMATTLCGVCGERPLYARYDPSETRAQTHRPTPRTCGRLACEVRAGNMKAVEA